MSTPFIGSAWSRVSTSPGRRPTCHGAYARCTCVTRMVTSSESVRGLRIPKDETACWPMAHAGSVLQGGRRTVVRLGRDAAEAQALPGNNHGVGTGPSARPGAVRRRSDVRYPAWILG